MSEQENQRLGTPINDLDNVYTLRYLVTSLWQLLGNVDDLSGECEDDSDRYQRLSKFCLNARHGILKVDENGKLHLPPMRTYKDSDT